MEFRPRRRLTGERVVHADRMFTCAPMDIAGHNGNRDIREGYQLLGSCPLAVFVFSSCIHLILTDAISHSKVFDRPVLADDCSLIPAYVTGFDVPGFGPFNDGSCVSPRSG